MTIGCLHSYSGEPIAVPRRNELDGMDIGCSFLDGGEAAIYPIRHRLGRSGGLRISTDRTIRETDCGSNGYKRQKFTSLPIPNRKADCELPAYVPSSVHIGSSFNVSLRRLRAGGRNLAWKLAKRQCGGYTGSFQTAAAAINATGSYV